MQEEMKCPKCGTDMKEYVTRFLCRNQNCKHEFKKFYPGGSAVGVMVASNTDFNLTTAENDWCTRPDMVDCHAKGGTGGRCMNGVRCPPLQVK